MTPWSDKTAIVTGGASGIGRALAAALTANGARVLIADINGVDEAAREIGCGGIEVDVTDAGAVGRCVRGFAAEHGRLDYIFNNAGVVVIGEARAMEYADWARILDVNVRGVVNGVFAAYPIMIEQRSGHIVNTASAAGLIPTPGAVAYAASKHAVVGLSRSLRAEAQAYGVRVSAVCPGFIRTPMADNGKMIGGVSRAEALSLVERRIGWMSPEDLAREVLDGVERNRALIIAPRMARFLVSAMRHFPALAERFAFLVAGRLRQLSAAQPGGTQ